MALIKASFNSDALTRITEFNMILPNDTAPETRLANKNYSRPMKTLILLHGFYGSNSDWLLGSQVKLMATDYNIAVIMPSDINSFYLDRKGTGMQYGTYVGEELLNYARKTFNLSEKREDTFIGGLSMGGFGAIHTGLAYNETFSKIIALSSAMIIHDIQNKKEGFEDVIADYDYYRWAFGDLSKLSESENNPEVQIKRLKKENKEIPPIFMAVGTEDFLLEENRAFHKFLTDEKVNVEYNESSGIHNWKFWSEYLEPSVKWALKD